MLPAWMYQHGLDHLADAEDTVAATSVVRVLGRLLIVVVGAGVGNTDIIDSIGSGVGDSAGVIVVGVDTCRKETYQSKLIVIKCDEFARQSGE